MSENRVLGMFELKGRSNFRKNNREHLNLFLTSITEMDQTERNWYMGHVKCKGKTREILKISMNFSLYETKM